MRFANDDVIIVQISDLHFGPEIYPYGASNNASPRWLHMLHGLRPHDIGACQELANTLKHMRACHRRSAMILVVAGDLTVMGDDSEFALALTFLGREVTLTFNRSVGLDGVFDLVVMIPGNHDHWGSRLYSAATTTAQPHIHGRYFPTDPARPWIFEEHRIGTNFQLQLMAIDSCDRTNFAARGSIDQTVLASLEKEIRHADGIARLDRLQVARILICHHSLAANAFHALDAASQTALAQFALRNKVHRILTGHTHASHLSETNLDSFGVELRSGTALQSKSPTNEFLVHRLFLDDQVLTIKTVPFIRTSGIFYEGKGVRRKLAQ